MINEEPISLVYRIYNQLELLIEGIYHIWERISSKFVGATIRQHIFSSHDVIQSVDNYDAARLI